MYTESEIGNWQFDDLFLYTVFTTINLQCLVLVWHNYLILLQQFVVCGWWHKTHKKQYTVYASNPHYFVNCIMYVLMWIITLQLIHYLIMFVLFYCCGHLACFPKMSALGFGQDMIILSSPTLMPGYCLMICICNFFPQISPFHPLLSSTCLVLYCLEIVTVLLQNKIMWNNSHYMKIWWFGVRSWTVWNLYLWQI
jgi:hypothetical protein